MPRKKEPPTYQQILDTARSVLYKHLQALQSLPSTEEQVEGKRIPKGYLTDQQADFARKCLNDLFKIYQEASAAGNEEDLSRMPSSEVTTQLQNLLEEQNAESTRGANRRSQA